MRLMKKVMMAGALASLATVAAAGAAFAVPVGAVLVRGYVYLCRHGFQMHDR
jgi:hypothetical protein